LTTAARQASKSARGMRRHGILASALLGLEVPVWLVGTGFGYGGPFLLILMLAAIGLTLVAIALLDRSPRSGVWLGLVLQAALVLLGLVSTLIASSLFGVVELGLGMVTAITLAVAMPRGGSA